MMMAYLLLVLFTGAVVSFFVGSPGKNKKPEDIQNKSEEKLTDKVVGAASQNGTRSNMDDNPKQDDQINIEEMISERRMERKERSAGFCSKCGRPVQQSDVYCPGCGEKIN